MRYHPCGGLWWHWWKMNRRGRSSPAEGRQLGSLLHSVQASSSGHSLALTLTSSSSVLPTFCTQAPNANLGLLNNYLTTLLTFFPCSHSPHVGTRPLIGRQHIPLKASSIRPRGWRHLTWSQSVWMWLSALCPITWHKCGKSQSHPMPGFLPVKWCK